MDLTGTRLLQIKGSKSRSLRVWFVGDGILVFLNGGFRGTPQGELEGLDIHAYSVSSTGMQQARFECYFIPN